MSVEPDGPDFFRDKPDEYLAWAAANPPKPGAAFCSRHWMPCPVDGKNGVLAAVLVMQQVIELIPDHVKVLGTEAMNAWLSVQKRAPCCQLGDERMEELWAGC